MKAGIFAKHIFANDIVAREIPVKAICRWAILVSVFAWMLQGVPVEGQSFTMASEAFSGDQMIPRKFSCQGDDISPQLSWKGAPAATKSMALIVDDPDAPAGTWVHWLLYNLPPAVSELEEGVEKTDQLSNGALQGKNDFRKVGYGGPCPPAGKAHRYFFKLYALDSVLSLKAGASKGDLENAMKGHILSQAELVGRYQRE